MSDRRAPSSYRSESRGDGRNASPYRTQRAPSRGGLSLIPAKSPDPSFTFQNVVAVRPEDVPPSADRTDRYLLLNGRFVVSGRPYQGGALAPGQIGLSDAQRTWMQVSLTDQLDVREYDPFQGGNQAYLGAIDVEIGFAGRKTTEEAYSQEELEDSFKHIFRNQIFSPGQQLYMDYKAIPLRLSIRTVELVDMALMSSEKESSQPTQQRTDGDARGILTQESSVSFFKDAKGLIKLKSSVHKPSANSVVRPDFKFDQLGIGGLDKEFSEIFRRAFASRIFPAGLTESMGIQHVRGLLLYGPPGTGKTLIARQIRHMLNAREPKIINGPEVLNKYVGQSEENIRKLFADAEKEQKEKGDESALHIIIFDELDAVCKQRGSGAGGGTGVGDGVVNQLLAKLDGVDQLNNLLLIGMTNRKDMIDEALLRPGRLEVHLEITLPNEEGRESIFKIKTAKMAANGKLGADVNLKKLAKITPNYSGAEIDGVTKNAASFALNRHIKKDTVAAVDASVKDIQVYMEDFEQAIAQSTPMLGASTTDLERIVEDGILPYSPVVQAILDEGARDTAMIRNGARAVHSMLLYGSRGSGKTALAAKIAMRSDFPFIKFVTPKDFISRTESGKIQHLEKMFQDAYKTPLNCLILDNIELLIDWVDVGPRFSSAVLGALKALLAALPPVKGRQLLVIATSTNYKVMKMLDLQFDTNIAVPNVETQQELATVMQQRSKFSDKEIRHAVASIESMTGTKEVNVGIKTVLTAIKQSAQTEQPAELFAKIMSEKIAQAAEIARADELRRY